MLVVSCECEKATNFQIFSMFLTNTLLKTALKILTRILQSINIFLSHITDSLLNAFTCLNKKLSDIFLGHAYASWQSVQDQ